MVDLKAIAKQIFLGTLKAIDLDSIIRKKLQVVGSTLLLGGECVDMYANVEVVLIGMGKASLKMGASVEKLLGQRIKRGILITNYRSHDSLRSEVLVAGHPLPDANSLVAGRKVIELVQSCDNDSLIVFLISGGGSSLVECPLSDRISLDDLRTTNQILIGCGASIYEINIVRKRLSRIKGGRLGYLARNSKCVGLYVSDVNPGDLRSIASNPLLPEESRFEEFIHVIEKFGLMRKLPESVVSVIVQLTNSGSSGDLTWSGPEPVTLLLLENVDALNAAAELAGHHGFRVELDTELIEGDYRAVADELINRLMKLKSSFPGERVCVISGGEVSCPVRGSGIGGRNQEFVLYSATRLADLGAPGRAAVLSCGTDGIDGNSKAAGAVADAQTVVEATRLGVDAMSFISNNDSYSFFERMGGLIETGPTGNNVRDIRILVAD
jgi:hydroxypyruvate reductase